MTNANRRYLKSQQEVIDALGAGHTVYFDNGNGQIEKTESGYEYTWDGGHVDNYASDTYLTIEEFAENHTSSETWWETYFVKQVA